MRLVIMKFPHVPDVICERVCAAAERLECEIVGVLSLEKNPTVLQIQGYPVLPLISIFDLEWDAAILACEDEDFFNDVVRKLVELGVGTSSQFQSPFWLLKQIMTLKYEDCTDPVIQETLEYWKTRELSVYNQHIDLGKGLADRVFRDNDCDLPYIYFKTIGGDCRKMYLSREKELYVRDGKELVEDVLWEQVPTSPHLYVTGEHQVHEGDILIDAGVCEGNFALKYVDICSKLYLFEPEKTWVEPLNQTFKDYRDKVEIIPRFVSDVTKDDSVTLDDVLPEIRGKNIFLKMDVEGAEPRSLRGAKNLLTQNKVRASICTYHNADDLVRVKSILHEYGFRTATSAGYMVFIYDSKIYDTADFRKGVVYAAN